MRRLVLLLVAACVLACTTATAPLRDPMGNGGAREQWLFDQRAYPFGDVPVDARRRALDEVRGRERVRSNAAGTVSAQWRAIGPSPVQTRWPWKSATGRVKAVAISPRDPNIVLAGSSSGGIWRSVDGGETFLPVSDTHSDLSVGAIAFAPSDPASPTPSAAATFLEPGCSGRRTRARPGRSSTDRLSRPGELPIGW
jgi:hypothetical protein